MDRTTTSTPYETGEKTKIRNEWSNCLKTLSCKLGRPLSFLTLSNNVFSDVLPIIPYTSTEVVENNINYYHSKHKWLKEHPEFTNKIKLIGPMDIYEHLKTLYDFQYDAINLDFCSHYSPKVIHILWTILNNHLLAQHSYLFLTLSRSTLATRRPELENKVLVKSFERVENQLQIDLNTFGYKFKPRFITRYKNINCQMFSFGGNILPL